MPFLAIVALSVGAAVFYGVIHDQITARLCLEYFTIAHPPIVASNSPTVQGLVWGVIATWWVGLLLGVPLAIVARTGESTPWDVKPILRPLAFLLCAMALCALVAGAIGFTLATRGVVSIGTAWVDEIPPHQQVRFIAVAWAHNASYLSGFVGGIILITYVYFARCGTALRSALR